MGRNLMVYNGIKMVLAVLIGLTTIQSVAIIFQAKWLAEVITALFHGESLTSQTKAIGLFLSAFMVRQIIGFIVKKTSYQFGVKTTQELRLTVMKSIFALGPRFTKNEGTGNLVTLITTGLQKLRTYLELFLPKLAAISVTPWLVLTFVWYQDRLSGIILLVTMPILILFMILLGLAAQKKIDSQWETYHVLSNHFVDSLRGLETLTFLGKSKEHAETIERVSDRYRKATMGTLRIAFLSTFALDFFTMLSVAIVAVMLGLRLVNGSMTLEPALIILLLAPEYFLPIREVGNDYHATLDGKESGDALIKIVKQAEKPSAKEEDVPNWTENSEIQLRHITVKYDEEQPPSLEDVSLHVKGSKKVGIIGKSGAGKSTLIDILSGFVQFTEGSAEVNGVPVDLRSDAWQKQITYIPQHPFIFNGTVKENIEFYQDRGGSYDYEDALTKAGLLSTVQQMPKKENEMIGDGGRQLSGGQAQRIALARAFLSDRPIIMLDEPTAQVDIETEYELKQDILTMFRDKLFILATHRLHWMKDMDLIVVIKDGKVVEIGNHQELIQKKGAYYQFLYEEEEI
ncbi:thiol reductant ABC exporter subunit CydD [Priestia megaterium]|uniref:thiol reductant ABC exporter subunit CydD n=1 Tax=Priestia megaterium TaxID=1404 RepID=UPI002E1B4FC0|nr:thiol reductant ABC exporter subunit CydD [Priestia megaterium]MED3979161.1 thiol reductant ABC exporter subunit CydD [Priestia megaterium]